MQNPEKIQPCVEDSFILLVFFIHGILSITHTDLSAVIGRVKSCAPSAPATHISTRSEGKVIAFQWIHLGASLYGSSYVIWRTGVIFTLQHAAAFIHPSFSTCSWQLWWEHFYLQLKKFEMKVYNIYLHFSFTRKEKREKVSTCGNDSGDMELKKNDVL